MKNKKNVRCLHEGNILMEYHLYREALKKLKEAYSLGEMIAAYKIGKIYMQSDVQNYEKAYYWLQLGAEAGERNALYYLSKFYEYDLLDKYDLNKAYQCLCRAAEQKEVRSILHLSFWYRTGFYVKRNPIKSWSLLSEAVELGSAEACYQMGQIYEEGNEHISPNLIESAAYYHQAARQKHSYALYRLGRWYWEGIFYRRNASQAIRYLEESSNLGCSEAQYFLSSLCGMDIYPYGYRKYTLLTAAAKQNHVQAMYDLGCMFLFGNSFIQEDKETAIYWFRKAAEHGHEKAKNYLK